jgi:hypothetical protein
MVFIKYNYFNYRQDNGYQNGSNSTNSEVNIMSSSALANSNNGASLSNCVPGRSQSLFKGSVTSEEGGHQPPAPPHRSFTSDVSAPPNGSSINSCHTKHGVHKNR